MASTLRNRNTFGSSIGDAGVRIVESQDTTSSASSSDDGRSAADEDSHLPTFTPPTFTVSDLLGAIPSHCFERSALKSSAYIVGDLIQIAIIVYCATFINPAFGVKGSIVDGTAGRLLRLVAWAAYAFLAGLPGTGLWVIAHECGHQAFSESKAVNNGVGWVLHSALLVPYHSWRISHAKHHAATGHMDRDMVFVPRTRSQRGLPSRTEQAKAKVADLAEKADDLFEDAPIYVLLWVLAQQLFGWPLYLLRNASAHYHPTKRTNHFEPESPIFDPKNRQDILWSDFGLAITATVLGLWISQRGFLEFARYYLGPYLWVNSNLVMITFLQHTDPQLPHYRNAEWNFVRGALCTIDRSYFEWSTHYISSTHVLHHSCSRIPHYHAQEASEAIKKVLGDHYMRSEEFPGVTLFKNYSSCRFVEDEGDVVFFKNAKGKAARRVAPAVADSGVEL